MSFPGVASCVGSAAPPQACTTRTACGAAPRWRARASTLGSTPQRTTFTSKAQMESGRTWVVTPGAAAHFAERRGVGGGGGGGRGRSAVGVWANYSLSTPARHTPPCRGLHLTPLAPLSAPRAQAAFDLVMETPVIKKVHFPNLVLGYGEDTEHKYHGQYAWTVEYQCIEKLGMQMYMGFNIYHREWDPPAASCLAAPCPIPGPRVHARACVCVCALVCACVQAFCAPAPLLQEHGCAPRAPVACTRGVRPGVACCLLCRRTDHDAPRPCLRSCNDRPT